ncbi:MAG: PQQ-like beta-propeller repeat protein [Acidobacteria bacterium]|nr:PQQ-like beta-propeller repeat protein [Acidobacteriota bacterium]
MTQFLALLVAAACTAIALAQPRSDWSQWRGAQRDGLSRLTIPAAWPATLKKRWEVAVGLGHSSPVVSGSRVVLHSRQGDREIVRALDLTTGQEIWRNDYPAPYAVNPAASGHGPGPKSTPAVTDGRVFTLGISGILSAIDVTTGKLLWRHAGPQAPPEFGTAMSPIVEDTMVIVHRGANDKGTLVAYDVATGKQRWEWAGDGPAYASPIVSAVDGVRQLITQSENAVIGVEVATGKLLWQVPFKTNFDQNSITPVVVRDLVIYSGLEGGTAALRIGRNGAAWTARQVWRNEQVSMYMSSPVISGETLYGLSHRNRGQFFAMELAAGKTLWTTPGREGENASLMVAGPLLLLSTTNAELIVARADAAKFDEVKRYTVAGSAVWAHPAIAGTAILVKDVDKLICWDV